MAAAPRWMMYGHAVELRGLPAQPQPVQLHGLAPGRSPHDLLGHHRECAARAREAGRLREAPELDGHLARPLHLEDGVGNLGIADVRLVGRVVQQDGAVVAGVVDPALEGGARHHRARRIVRVAQVDEVDGRVGERRLEAVLRRARQIHEARIAARLVGRAGAPGHHVAVDVHGIDGIRQGHHGLRREDLLDVAAVALGPVAHEDLVGGDRHPAGAVVVLGDQLGEELVAGLGAVAAEGLGARHLVDRLVERADHHGRQGPGDVADAEADDLGGGMGVLEGLHAPGDLDEEIAALELQIVLVDARHRCVSSRATDVVSKCPDSSADAAKSGDDARRFIGTCGPASTSCRGRGSSGRGVPRPTSSP